MGCGAEEPCLHEHVFPRLKDPVPAGEHSYRAFATCHPDATRSLSVSWLDERIQWNCFACKERLGNDKAQIATRNSLIQRRVPNRCLPQGRDDLAAQMEAIREIVEKDGKPAQRLFRIAAILDGWGDGLPAGLDLEALADSCHVSHRTGYDARLSSHDR